MLKYSNFCLMFLILFSLNKTHAASCEYFIDSNFTSTTTASPPLPSSLKSTNVATNNQRDCKFSCFRNLLDSTEFSTESKSDKLAVYCKHIDGNGLTKQKWIKFNYKTAIKSL